MVSRSFRGSGAMEESRLIGLLVALLQTLGVESMARDRRVLKPLTIEVVVEARTLQPDSPMELRHPAAMRRARPSLCAPQPRYAAVQPDSRVEVQISGASCRPWRDPALIIDPRNAPRARHAAADVARGWSPDSGPARADGVSSSRSPRPRIQGVLRDSLTDGTAPGRGIPEQPSL